MAVTTTALGFKKPDGNELAKGGDNVISDNAQTAETVIAAVRSRLATVELAVATGGGGGGGGGVLIEDPADPGFYLAGGAA